MADYSIRLQHQLDAARGVVNAIDVPVGARLLLLNGDQVEVVDNPGDGVWLFCRPVLPDGTVDRTYPEVPVYAAEVAGTADA